MKFTTKTEYGLVCLIYMARYIDRDAISIKELAQQEQFSLPYLEKILQNLRAAGIVVAHHGKQGGYHLAKHPSQITLKDIVLALEGDTFEVYCEPDLRKEIVCTHFSLCGIRPVWAKIKLLLDDFFGTITLETLSKHESAVKSLVA